jgi:hypothetical protein
MFIGITARIISASALMSGIPAPQDRGAFMSISSSVQQVSGGFASAIAGMIVLQVDNGPLQRYDLLGYVVIGTMLASIAMMYFIKEEVVGTGSGGAVANADNPTPGEPLLTTAGEK